MNVRTSSRLTLLRFYLLLPLLAVVFVVLEWIIPHPTGTPYIAVGTGKWSYGLALAPYYALLLGMAWRYQVILQFATWRVFFFLSVGVVFLTAWEFFHSCLNHDWVYVQANILPFVYTYNGAGIPLTQFFGYLTAATTFQALMMLLILRFDRIVIRNPKLIPFASKGISSP